jgi:hypothetical protein
MGGPQLAQSSFARAGTPNVFGYDRSPVKNATKDNIIGSGDDFIRQLLLKADLPMRNVRLLFD